MNSVRRSTILPFLVTAALLASCGGDPAAPAAHSGEEKAPAGAPSILLVTLDTTRADRLGCYGYAAAKTPNLDALAKEGVMFNRAYCQTPMTLPSHASILTGLYPMHHGIRLNGPYRLPDSVPTVAQILQKEGWVTGAFVSAVVLDSQYGLDRGFEVYDDDLARDKPGRAERRAEETVGLALGWLAKLPKEKPWFAWVHLFDPHFPYEPPEPYKSEFADSPYDGEIAYMDEMVGRLIVGARESAPKDNLMIIATADHGEGLGEHREKTHSLFLYDSTIRVPLIVSYPSADNAHAKSNGAMSDTVTESVDLVGCLLDVVGLKGAWTFDGDGMPVIANDTPPESDARLAYAETYYPLSFGWSPVWSARRAGWKHILDSSPELYSDTDQPAESLNRIVENADRARKLRSEIERLLDSAITFESNMQSPGDTSQVRDLGYLGSGMKEGDLEELLKFPDPMDRVEDFDAINAARGAVKVGRPDEALAMLEPILVRDPENPVLLQVLGSAYVALNRIDDAVTTLAKYHELAPDDLESAVYLGNALLRQNKAAEAEPVLRACVEKLPTYAEAWDQLGVALGMQGKVLEAVEAGRRAHELAPTAMEFHLHYAVSLLNSGRAADAEKHLHELASKHPERKDIARHLNLAIGSFDPK